MRSVVVLAALVAAVLWLLNWIVQRVVLAALVVMVFALSGCYWIAPPVDDTNPDIDLLCRPDFHPVCQGEGSGGEL